MPQRRQLQTKKSKWKWLKHPFVLALVAGAFVIIAALLKSSSPSLVSNSNTVNVDGNNSGQIAGGNILNQTVVSPPPTEKTVSKWQPPELPPGCSNVFVSFGGQQLKIPMFVAKVSSEKIGTKVLFNDIPPEFSFFTNGYEKLPGYNASTSGMFFRVGSVQTKIEGRSVDYPILPYVRDNRLFVYVSMPFQNEKRIVSMSDDLDSVIPQTWDRNYSSNAFEVVNEDGRPVLQVFYKRPNDVQVNGVFVVNGYALFESFGAMPWLISPYVRVTQNQTTQEFEIADFQRTFTNIAISMDTNAAYGTKFTDQKPIFKYPAWKYLGQYAEEEVPRSSPGLVIDY